MSPELGPSPTAVFSPEPTTVVSPEPTTVVSPEPVPETSSGTSTDHTSTVLNSSGLGPEPTMVHLVSPGSVGPEPISLSLEPGSNHASSGPEPVSVPLEPTRTAEEEEEEEEAVVPLPSEPIHTADKMVKEEGQERKEVKEERGKKVKEGRKTKEGKKGKKVEKDEVAAKPAQEEEQKPSSGKHHIHV